MRRRGLVALAFSVGLGQAAMFGQGLPNLKPFQAFGWPDTLVVHTNAGQPLDVQVVYENQDIYVDWAVFNDGLVAATNRFLISVFVDNTPRATWFSSGLSPQFWTWISDGNIGRLGHGFHTVRVEIDSGGVIEEADETDNVVEQQIAVTSTNAMPVQIFQPQAAEGSFAFSVLGPLGRRYQVEYSNGVTDWQPLDAVTNITGIVPLNYPASEEQRSYRVRLLSP